MWSVLENDPCVLEKNLYSAAGVFYKCYNKNDLRRMTHMWYDSIYMKCLESADPWRQRADEWLLGAEEMLDWRVTANGIFITPIRKSHTY